jgi:PAS domain S-box-containing protein
MKAHMMPIPQDKVLYIDDEQTNLDLFQVLFMKDFEVITTLSTQEARTILAANEIKVVVTDLKMPDENGLEFIQSVSPHFPHTYYIILTAFLDVEAAMQAINQGNTYKYILKPWDSNQIRLTLKEAIKAYDLSNENRGLIARIATRDRQLNSVFIHSSDGIVIFDSEKHILLANPAFATIMDIDIDEPHFLDDAFNVDGFPEFLGLIRRLFDRTLPEGEFLFELDNNGKYVEINTSLIDYNDSVAAISIVRDITERRLGARRIFNSVIEAEERERNRLARDLHDGIGPVLSTVKMYIEWLSDKSRSGNPEQILELANSSINEAIQQVRHISHNLSPHILDKFGLITGLQSHIDSLKQTTDIEFNLNSNLKLRPNKPIELTVYRALKECINNTVKYAGATNVYIVVLQDDGKLSVTYSDNGCGFDMAKVAAQNNGIGLYNIRNRIESLGGKVDILSAPNMGTRIKMEIKLVDDIPIFN